MECINLPLEIFVLILEHVKSQQYNITTLRKLARTCKRLNYILSEYIAFWQNEYHNIYTKLGCTIEMTLKYSYINELILDELYEATIDESECHDVICYASAIIGNLKLMKQIPKHYAISIINNISICAGYGGHYEMFEYLWNDVLVLSWGSGMKGALLADNTSFLRFCRSCELDNFLSMCAQRPNVSPQCHNWFVKHGYCE